MYHRKETMAEQEEVANTPEELESEVAPEATEDAVSTEESAEMAEEVAEEKAEPKKKTAEEAPKKAPHSVKHKEAAAHVDRTKSYSLAEAIELVKKTSYTKFDGAMDVHVRLTAAKKSDENVRGTVTLPHGTGKEKRVVIITEDMIEKIEKGWLDFDVAVTTPDVMPKLAKLAKILGPKGLMPNPKSGTVTPEPEKVAQELKGGRVEFKADSLGNIHQSLGRVSWDAAKITENFQTFIGALPKSRIKSVTLAPTMGPGVKVTL